MQRYSPQTHRRNCDANSQTWRSNVRLKTVHTSYREKEISATDVRTTAYTFRQFYEHSYITVLSNRANRQTNKQTEEKQNLLGEDKNKNPKPVL